jgi:hypothetical protein
VREQGRRDGTTELTSAGARRAGIEYFRSIPGPATLGVAASDLQTGDAVLTALFKFLVHHHRRVRTRRLFTAVAGVLSTGFAFTDSAGQRLCGPLTAILAVDTTRPAAASFN